VKLCIAEKPSVGKEIARILGANTRRDGFYEGNGYLISWTFGHFCTLKSPEDYSDDWKRWSLDFLPMLPPKFQIKLIDNSGVQKQYNILKNLIDQCTEVINCGDAGIEGELIQRWVLAKALCNKPVKRLWISSMTDEAIREGFDKLKDASAYDLLYAAGNARAMGDWLLGMNASRLYTVKYAQGKGVLSIGRVQTPTLALIVNRYKEIMSFVPEAYWELKTNYRNVNFNSSQRKFKNKEDAQTLLAEIKNKEFEITSVTKKNSNESPLPLFDLTGLQVECNKKFNFTADDTLKYIQKLYEQKLVTYPRVDTTYLPENMYPKIPDILKNLRPYAALVSPLLSKPLKKSKKVFDDKKITDHHAIIPTGVEPYSGMMIQEKQIYDTITKRFIAAFYPDCIASNTSVLGKVDIHEFTATGKIILEEGWRVVYPKKDASTDEKEASASSVTGDKEDEIQEMPNFVVGEKGPHVPDLQEKQTQAPKHHTEATLLRAMETAGKQVEDAELRELMKDNGIGRPSTRANIIETLFKRNYVTRQKKNLIPTITGVELIQTINNELLKSVELTGQWEKKLRQIEKGEYDPPTFLQEMKDMVASLVNEVKLEHRSRITIEAATKEITKSADAKAVDQTADKATDTKTKAPKKKIASTEEMITCPKCKAGTIMKGKAAYGCNAYKEGCTFKVEFEISGKKLSDSQLLLLIKKGKSPVIKGFTIDSKKVNGIVTLDDNFKPVLKVEASTSSATKKLAKQTGSLSCPKCKTGVMMKGKTAWGCSRFKEDCRFVIPFEVLQKNNGSNELTAEFLRSV
jgi:DNA topoisomerase-3